MVPRFLRLPAEEIEWAALLAGSLFGVGGVLRLVAAFQPGLRRAASCSSWMV